ncbi:MAG: hypothetical protein K2I81_01145 [Alphaproteobacteria bacterium]|nr:hypothetical protein [Alphaproteobacteria bacterium]
MYLSVITHPDEKNKDKYEIARAIYAETGAVSLRLTEAMASMISNAAKKCGKSEIDIVRNQKIFRARYVSSSRHSGWYVNSDYEKFQMCLRVTQKMLNGTLGDLCCGATRFHHDDELPDWATSLGYVADIDGILFYL